MKTFILSIVSLVALILSIWFVVFLHGLFTSSILRGLVVFAGTTFVPMSIAGVLCIVNHYIEKHF